MALSCKQGIHPQYNKQLTKDKKIKYATRPERVVIPLKQHIGATCQPLVTKGDRVSCGQKIADSDSFVSAPVHASISGVVKDITETITAAGVRCPAVVITADGDRERQSRLCPLEDPAALSPEKIRQRVREAGITGMGGAMFPTHVKLSIPEDKKIDYFVLNGAECEPYLTVDDRLMVERAEDVLRGMKLLMQAINVNKGIIGIEANKPQALKVIKKITIAEEQITVKVLEAKYPQGGEIMLIKALLGRDVPDGGLPLDCGAVVNNVATAVAVSEAVTSGKPLIERAITVSGSAVKNPGNYIFRIGTPIKELIAEAGGFVNKPARVILGGPMMGLAQADLERPLVKGSSGILVLSENEVTDSEPLPCIKCARCVDACPRFLLPTRLVDFIKHDMYEKMEQYKLNNCIECGCCAYVCPAKIPLVHYLKLGKAELQAEKSDNHGK